MYFETHILNLVLEREKMASTLDKFDQYLHSYGWLRAGQVTLERRQFNQKALTDLLMKWQQQDQKQSFLSKIFKDKTEFNNAKEIKIIKSSIDNDKNFDWETKTTYDRCIYIVTQENHIMRLMDMTKQGHLEVWQIARCWYYYGMGIYQNQVIDGLAGSKEKPKFHLKDDQIIFTDDAYKDKGKREITMDDDNYYVVFDDWIYCVVKQRDNRKRTYAICAGDFTPTAEKILGVRWDTPSQTQLLWKEGMFVHTFNA